MRVIANLSRLARIVNFASTEATRFYLQGVAVDATRPSGRVLVATDGHIMGMWKDADAYVEGTGAPAIIASATILEAWKAAPKIAKAKGYDLDHLRLVIDGDHKRALCTIEPGEEPTPGEERPTLWRAPTDDGHLVDGTFPDWRRVVPRIEPGHHGAPAPVLSAVQLGMIAKAVATGGRISSGWIQVTGGNPKDPQLVTAPAWADFLGVIMPATQNVGTAMTPGEVETRANSFAGRP